MNRDQLTGFGTPREIRFQANYTVLRKGGNVDGYSALLSYIPDLELGKDVLCYVYNIIPNTIHTECVRVIIYLQPTTRVLKAGHPGVR